MMQDDGGLGPDYLRRQCPVAWNTEGRKDAYARLGYDLTSEALRLVQEYLGPADGIEPEDMPVGVRLRFSVARGEDGLIVRVAKRQDARVEPGARRTPCEPDPKNPPLTARYIDEHQVSTWDEAGMEPSYRLLGYMAIQELVHDLIEAGGAPGGETERLLTITVSSTHMMGGCVIVCSGRACVHKHRN